MSWNCSYSVAYAFIMYNLIGQLGSVGMVLLRLKIDLACFNLFFTVLLQTIAYSILWDGGTRFMRFRN